MLTIEDIDKITMGTLNLGDNNKEYQDWDIFDVIPYNEYYQIRLKCIRCSPASPILGQGMDIYLWRNKKTIGVGSGMYKLSCDKLRKTAYINKENMKTHTQFINMLLKWIDNKLVTI